MDAARARRGIGIGKRGGERKGEQNLISLEKLVVLSAYATMHKFTIESNINRGALLALVTVPGATGI